MKKVIYLIVLSFSVSANAEKLPLAFGYTEPTAKCTKAKLSGGDDHGSCALSVKIGHYNELAERCNEEIDGILFDDELSSSEACVAAMKMHSDPDIRLDK